jgi:hypothetical protein
LDYDLKSKSIAYDFDANGLDYEDYADMIVGEVRSEANYEGIMVIRIK